MSTPVVITVYNRLSTLKKTLDSLFECDGIEDRHIYFYEDGDESWNEDIDNVRIYIGGISMNHPCQIVGHDWNLGLRKNALYAIEDALAIYDKIIFIQDDQEFSKDFLTYMDWALTEFEDRQDIMFVSGYSHIDYPSCYLSPLIADGLGIWKDKFPHDIGTTVEYLRRNERYLDYDAFAKDTTHSFASYLKDIVNSKSDAFMALLCFRMHLRKARCLHPGRNKLRYLVSDSTNSKKKDSKNYNNTLYEGFNKQLDESNDAYNTIKETKCYKWSKLKRFTRWLRTL